MLASPAGTLVLFQPGNLAIHIKLLLKKHNCRSFQKAVSQKPKSRHTYNKQSLVLQARMQTFEKWGANFRYLHSGVRILRKWGKNNWGVNSVSGEKLQDFEKICPQLGCAFAPSAPHLHMGLYCQIADFPPFPPPSPQKMAIGKPAI